MESGGRWERRRREGWGGLSVAREVLWRAHYRYLVVDHPPTKLRRAAEWGMVDPRREQASTQLETHVPGQDQDPGPAQAGFEVLCEKVAWYENNAAVFLSSTRPHETRRRPGQVGRAEKRGGGQLEGKGKGKKLRAPRLWEW